MKKGMYFRLAWTGIRKNKKLYTPYILTCIGMVMMSYIVSFLAGSDVLRSMRGGDVMQSMLGFGFGVIGVFSVIFLFYTNSFLIRRRKREFGLYNILGMGKGNLARVLIWESLIIAVIALAVGLAAGILLSKFAELGMINVLNGEITFSLTIAPQSILQTLALFGIVFALILLNALRQIHLTNPIELLRSENAGEKPPKANWFFALAGAVILGIAYYMAVSIEDPISALIWFFVAVTMVIVATYLLFIAGSVAVCRLLQKKKSYYYKTNHFVSVSSMVYRMKRNGAGLASICILCTMVLVMVSPPPYACLSGRRTACAPVSPPYQPGRYGQRTGTAGLRTDGRGPGAVRADGLGDRSDARKRAGLPRRRLCRLCPKRPDRDGQLPPVQFQLSAYSDVWQVFVVPVEGL